MVKLSFGEKILAELPFGGLGLNLKALLEQVKYLTLRPVVRSSDCFFEPEHQRPAGFVLLIFLNREIRGT